VSVFQIVQNKGPFNHRYTGPIVCTQMDEDSVGQASRENGIPTESIALISYFS
jgi:hypothetical protein